MNLYGLMITRNESHRYLDAVCRWTTDIVDALVVFDDCSDDDSADIAESVGAIVAVRKPDAPSFADSESSFRQAAWEFLADAVRPSSDDYVLVVDADEFVVTVGYRNTRTALLAAIDQAEQESCAQIDLPVAEVFGMLDTRPLIRNDGQWAKIRAAALGRWQPSLRFKPVPLACGRLPQISGPPLRIGDPMILHCGYLRSEDRVVKRMRYSRRGHGGAHVRSITERGIYEPYTQPLPELISAALQEDK